MGQTLESEEKSPLPTFPSIFFVTPLVLRMRQATKR